MDPTNTDKTPFIFRFLDSLGVQHTVVPSNHTHTMSEVTDLPAIDTTPTANSTKLVTSGGVAAALATKATPSDISTAIAGKADTTTVNAALSAKADKVSGATNNNFAALDSNGNIKDSGKKTSDFATAGHTHSEIALGEDNFVSATEGEITIGVSASGEGGEVSITPSNIDNLERALQNPDSTPTLNSDKLVTSGGVKTALNGKMDTKTIDSTPTTNSNNLVTSGGVKAAIDEIVIGSGFVSTDTLVIPSGAIVKPMPLYIKVDDPNDPINLDTLISLDGATSAELGMARLCLENAISGSSGEDWESLLVSEGQNPIHTNSHGSTTFAEGEFVILTVYRLDKSTTEHDHDYCYFVTLDGIFGAAN